MHEHFPADILKVDGYNICFVGIDMLVGEGVY